MTPVNKPRDKQQPTRKRNRFYRNTRPLFIILLIPMIVGIATATVIAGGLYRTNLASFGSKRLETQNWSAAKQTMQASQPNYDRKFAYYKVKDGQDLAEVAAYFSVDQAKLAQLNPGTIAPGTTIKIPPPEKPYTPTQANGQIARATITEDRGIVRIANKYRLQQPIITDIPELARFTARYNIFEQTGPTTWRLNRPVSIDGDIRMDLTPATVTKLELTSKPGLITCLCFDQSATLFQNVEVTSYDPATGKPDPNFADGRSFVRMKNGRMDLVNSKFNYLGNALDEATEAKATDTGRFLQEGGIYGVSWRISSGTLGTNVTTGWVEDTRFERNHFGTYTYGAFGMMWRDNYFGHNDIYGLDPHDDSNGALVEGNIFDHNGKHGFIVSKRCNYNIIRNNISIGNKLHGFMLHQESAYNLMENNVAYGNEDNYVVFESNFNTIRNNKSYSPNSAHIRINSKSNNSFVTGNQMYGGSRGIFLYDQVNLTLIAGNTINSVKRNLQTEGARNTLFAENTIDGLRYRLAADDEPSMIYGPNTISSKPVAIPDEATLLRNFEAQYR